MRRCRHSGAGASPLKRAGRDFKPHGSVRVRVVSGTRSSTRRFRASRGGRFTVTFDGFAFPSCGADGYGGLYAQLDLCGRGMKVAAVATLREALHGAVRTGE